MIDDVLCNYGWGGTIRVALDGQTYPAKGFDAKLLQGAIVNRTKYV